MQEKGGRGSGPELLACVPLVRWVSHGYRRLERMWNSGSGGHAVTPKQDLDPVLGLTLEWILGRQISVSAIWCN